MEIATLDTQDLKGEVSANIDKIKSLTITTQEDAQKAADLRADLKGLEKRITEFFKPLKQKAEEAHKALVKTERDHLAPVKEAIAAIDGKVLTWNDEQERVRLAEQRRLEELARKRAEEDQIAEAEAAEKAGDKAAAQAIIAAPTVVSPVVAKAAPKLNGAAVTVYYGAQTYDLKALARAVAEGKAPIDALAPNEPFLNACARTRKQEGADLYPGVKIIAKRGLRS